MPLVSAWRKGLSFRALETVRSLSPILKELGKMVQCPRGKGRAGKTDEANTDCSKKISAFEGI
jgi:hypothetical protein